MTSKTCNWQSLFFCAFPYEFKIQNDKEIDFLYTEEPHSPRRQAILKKYPEIKKLMGHDPTIALIVSVEVLIQILACWIISLTSPSYPLLIIAAYCFGGVLNHSLGSAIHEIGHNLAFGHARPKANRALSIFCNLPIGIPMAISYKKYHADHHRWLGHDPNDVDIPMRFESLLFRHSITKVLWLIFFPFIHAIRPFFKSPRPISHWELVNIAVQLTFDAIIFKIFGVKSLFYLIAGSALGLGLHPLAGHFLSEHYLFREGQATMSYYGPLNRVLFNVGYHIEHHDFPYIPYTRLPKVREIAKEFYQDIPFHTSWCKVLWDFVWQDKMGPKARGVVYGGGVSPKKIE